MLKSASVGDYGLGMKGASIPLKEKLERTVLTVGGTYLQGIAVAALHAVTWIVAITLIFAGANEELKKVDGVTDTMKNVGTAYGSMVIAILICVVLHASTARKEDKIYAPLISTVLLFTVIFENVLGTVYFMYAVTNNTSKLVDMVVASNALVVLGSAMVLAFYVNWSANGDLENGAVDGLLRKVDTQMGSSA
jgi:hypothetical protein